MSGFEKPSAEVPYADHGATVSSDGSDVCCWSTAPTVMMNGSLPGATDMSTGPTPVPKLPDAATTVIPENHSRSTALSRGSKRKVVGDAPAIEKFATLMLYCALCARIQSAALMTSLVIDWPPAFAVRRLTIGAPGAAPRYDAF